jgi:hypothetical protein
MLGWQSYVSQTGYQNQHIARNAPKVAIINQLEPLERHYRCPENITKSIIQTTKSSLLIMDQMMVQ